MRNRRAPTTSLLVVALLLPALAHAQGAPSRPGAPPPPPAVVQPAKKAARSVKTTEAGKTAAGHKAAPGHTAAPGRPAAEATPGPAASAAAHPLAKPSATASAKSSAKSSAKPTARLATKPSATASAKSSARSSAKPTARLATKPSAKPSATASAKSSAKPSGKPTARLAAKPTAKSSAKPSARLAARPTAKPSAKAVAKPAAASAKRGAGHRRGVAGRGAGASFRIAREAPKGRKHHTRSRRPPPDKRRFIEGELANVGASGLVPWENRFGVVVGPVRLGDVFYLEVRPAINYTTLIADRDFTMSFAIPVRLEMLDTRPDRGWTTEGGRGRIGTIREEDWDQWQDYARIIRYINYGGKEEHFYFDVNGFKASSIGHGTVLKRYNPNLNLNRRRVSAELDAFLDYGGFEAFINDVTGPNILSGLAFIKPLSFIDRSNYFLRSFSIGATFTTDLEAPMRAKLDRNDVDQDGKRETELLIDQRNFNPITVEQQVVSYGTSVEMKLIDTDQVDWKTYFDLSFLETGLPTDWSRGGYMFFNDKDIGRKAMRSSGAAWGHLLRLNLGSKPVHALRIRLELRRYDNNYLPSYFDTMYEVQNLQYGFTPCVQATANDAPYALANNTKLQCVLGRDPNADKVLGAYFEASWKVGHYWAMAIAMEINDRKGPDGQGTDNNFFVHLEMPHVGAFQWLATYHRRSRSSVGDLFAFGSNPADQGIIGGNDIFILKGRYRLSDMIYFNGEILTPFGIGPDSLFRNAIEINVNAEFGFGYGGDRDKEDDG